MSEPNGLGCGDLADMAAELALGVLTGRERAQAIAHLDRCDACMESVRQMAVIGEKLLDLLPGTEPPAGFETRVISRLGIDGQHRRRQRARWMLAAAAAVAIAVGGGAAGWGLHGATPRSSPEGSRTAQGPFPAGSGTAQGALRSATLMTASRHTVGEVFLHTGSQPWLYMAVDTGLGNNTVVCQLESRDGHVTTVGSFRLDAGYGYWGNPVPIQASAVTGARLTTQDGTVLATAAFSSAR